MKNYTSQSAGQSYSWLCIMLTSHNHRCCDREMWREERQKQERENGKAKGGDGKRRNKYDRNKDDVKWSGEEKE